MNCDVCNEKKDNLKEMVDTTQKFQIVYYICSDCWNEWQIAWKNR